MKRAILKAPFGHLILPVLTLAALGACSPLHQLQTANYQASGVDGFRAAIADEYAAFAKSEDALGHTANRDHFARKGLAALSGAEIPPEPLDPDALNDAQMDELRLARQRLLGVRTEFLERVVSLNVARAQLFFDCWVTQAASDSEQDLSVPCRQTYLSEMQTIEQVVQALGNEPDVSLPVDYTILFDTGDSELSRDGEYAIEQALATLTLFPTSQLEITGHTDRDGSRSRNLALSKARAETVQAALAAVGIPPEQMHILAVGEDDLATPTLDGIRRDGNRRVTIHIRAPHANVPDAANTTVSTPGEEHDEAPTEGEADSDEADGTQKGATGINE